MGSCLFKTFRWDLKWDVLFETFETWNFSNPSWGVAYLKLSDETWNEMCYLKLLKLVTFQTHHGELLIWNFQMRLEKEVLFKIFETCNFSNPSWGVAYLKLSDETWNEMCYLKLLKLVTFQTHHGELLIWNFQMRLEKEVLFKIFETCNFSNPSWGVAYLKLSDETWNEMCYLKLLKLETFQTHHGSWLFETFRWDLKKRCYLKFLKLVTFQIHHGELLIWNIQIRLEMRCAIWNFETWNFSNLILGNVETWNLFETDETWSAYLKLSDETWNKILLFEIFETCFSNPSWELLIWNFQMRLETRYSIWNVWNLKLLKHVMGVAYLKLSDEIWNEMCYMKLLKLETSQTCHGSCLFETFRWDLKLWNFSNPSWGVAYLKLSDETWNESYMKLLKLGNFSWGVLYLKFSDETWDCYKTFETWETFRTHHRELLIWNSDFEKEVLFKHIRWDLKQMFLITVWNLKLFKPSHGELLIWKLSDETWKPKLVTFQIHHGELLIWNFQMRLETIYSIWNVWNLKLFKHVMGVAYLKLSDETWNEMCYMKLLKLETFQTCHGSCLFETFRWDLKWDVLFEIFETWNFSNMSWELLIWNFQMRLIFYLICLKLETFQTCHGSCLFETFRWDLKWDVLFEIFETWNFSNMSWELLIWISDETWQRGAIWNFSWNFSNPSWGVAYLKLSDETWNKIFYLKCLKLETSQTCHGSCLFETFRWDLKWDVLYETFETWNFSNMSWELLIWNFQMRLEKEVLFEIFQTWNFSNPSWGVAYLKLSDETWNEMCYMKLLKLETFQTHHGEFFIWNFQMRLEMRCAIWNFWNLKLFKPIIGSCLFETFRWDLKKRCYLKFLKLVTFQIHHGELLI